ncbi:MAG: DUF1893 domain-containing protein [Propionibacteriaceae bacterium]|jgi:hypothetical protein|nr:DUF1893 domain-containing protein [Propionibacteriaceae bacterium]
MSTDLAKARKLLDTGSHTGVLCRGDEIVAWDSRGLRELVKLLKSGKEFTGFSAADKVVGKAAALLYRAVGIDQLYAQLASDAGVATLSAANIPVQVGSQVANILNRDRDGLCPMELATADTDDPLEALARIENFLASLPTRAQPSPPDARQPNNSIPS